MQGWQRPPPRAKVARLRQGKPRKEEGSEARATFAPTGPVRSEGSTAGSRSATVAIWKLPPPSLPGLRQRAWTRLGMGRGRGVIQRPPGDSTGCEAKVASQQPCWATQSFCACAWGWLPQGSEPMLNCGRPEVAKQLWQPDRPMIAPQGSAAGSDRRAQRPGKGQGSEPQSTEIYGALENPR